MEQHPIRYQPLASLPPAEELAARLVSAMADDGQLVDPLTIARDALLAVLNAGRGTSGRLILDAAQEQAVRDALVKISPVLTPSPGHQLSQVSQTLEELSSTP